MTEPEQQNWTVEDLLQGKPAEVVALFTHFMSAVQACGLAEVELLKDRVVLHGSRRIFASVAPTAQSLRGHLNLPRRIDDPRLPRVEPLTKRLFFHRFTLASTAELDEEFVGRLHEAYAVGQGAHLRASPPPR